MNDSIICELKYKNYAQQFKEKCGLTYLKNIVPKRGKFGKRSFGGFSLT